jgi:1-acyl-sn-glycerol-3-phosphate acyltransferase
VGGGLDVAFFSLRALFGPVLTAAFRLKTVGAEHVPKSGPAILAANHASFLDPILISIPAKRPVRFLVSNQFYRDRRLHALLRCLGTIPVGGDAGVVRSFRRVAEVIDDGGLLGIFPEGGITRDGSMKPFRAGTAVLAMRLGVPIVPIHVSGTFDALPRYAKWPRFVPVTLRIGAPLPVPARTKPSSEEIAALTESIRASIASLASG